MTQESRLSRSTGPRVVESIGQGGPRRFRGGPRLFWALVFVLMPPTEGGFPFFGDTAACLYTSGSFFVLLLRFRFAATRIGGEPIGAAAISPCRL
jgi:hypothetical protein